MHILVAIYSDRKSDCWIRHKIIWWLLFRRLYFKIQMIPRTFFLLNSNGNNTFNRRRPKSQFFCCPHFVMISLLGIGQKSSHVCFSADFSTQTRMAWGQILTWFWRFTVGDEQRGTWDNWITKEKTWNVWCLQKYTCVSSIDSLLSGIILYSTCTALYEAWPTSLTGSTQQTGNLSVGAAFDGFCSFLHPSTEICHIWL